MKRKTDLSAREKQPTGKIREQQAVSRYLAQLKFAPRLFGVDEADVWKKILRLCELYEDALEAERCASHYSQEAASHDTSL